MDEFERVQERLTRVRPTLSPTLNRAAAYMLEHPADVVTMSMRELARAADIPAPNFSRLAQQVGFVAYSKLRAVYRQRVHSGRPIHDSTPDRVPPPPTERGERGGGAVGRIPAAALGNLAGRLRQRRVRPRGFAHRRPPLPQPDLRRGPPAPRTFSRDTSTPSATWRPRHSAWLDATPEASATTSSTSARMTP